MNSAVFEHGIKQLTPIFFLFAFTQKRQPKGKKRKEADIKAKFDLWVKLLLMVVKKSFSVKFSVILK